MAVEEPAFRTVLQDGAFEIRDYPALVVAEVTVTGGQKEAASKGFRLLAGYIFGGNRGKQSIAMTAPVTEAPAGEKDRHDRAGHPVRVGRRMGRALHNAEPLCAGDPAPTERPPGPSPGHAKRPASP